MSDVIHAALTVNKPGHYTGKKDRWRMCRKNSFWIYALILITQFSVYPQTHIAVPLGNQVYHVIEQAQMRGLLRFQPAAKPYSRAMVLSIIDEILQGEILRDDILAGNGTRRFAALSRQERAILEEFRQTFNPGRGGLDLSRGTISSEHVWNDAYFSGEFGFGAYLGFSGAYYPLAGGFTQDADSDDPFAGANHPDSGDLFSGFDSGIYFSFIGDLGRKASYGLTIGGAFLKSPRAILGTTNTFSPGWTNDRYPGDEGRRNRQIIAYSEPMTFFPYTYKTNWDGSVWYLGELNAGGFEGWPQIMSVGYYMIPELSGSLLNGHVSYRFARHDREWGGMTGNSSLTLNQAAQPFLAGEITFMPFPWLSFSALTGVLEYGYMLETGDSGIKDAAATFQNAFSINMLEVNYKNYFHLDFGSATIWAKRFELGYLFPFADTFLYQNNIGDFDNSALFLNLLVQYPGLGKLWSSLFIDEISLGDINRNFFNMSRMMIAYQFGGSFYVPWFSRLSFSSLTFSYTKIEPYTYTHTREIVPGYGNLPMETNWVNRGRALGHYLPPNSDEILVRFDTMPALNSLMGLQYQLIRHGAEYGDRAVGGSSLSSELDPWGRHSKPNLRKYFLSDGAYQWMHIFRLKGEYSLAAASLSVRIFAELGGVYSFFTDIDSDIEPNSGKKSPYQRIDTPQYPRSLSFIGSVGVRVFPKF